MLEQIRAEEPDEPLWKGVKEITAETHGVRVTFEPGSTPSSTTPAAPRPPVCSTSPTSTLVGPRRPDFCRLPQDRTAAVRKASL